jgi:hypothetical protein
VKNALTKHAKTTIRKPFSETNEIKKLSLLVTIVDRDASDVFVDYFQTLESNLQIIIFGKGTATSELISLLGLSEPNKDIVLAIIKEEKIDEAFNYIKRRFEISKKHKGVAFSVGLESIIGVSIYKYLSNNVVNKQKGA